MKKYLLEIGTEELPYKFLSAAQEQIAASFKKMLTDNAVEFGDISVYATPRRLAVIVENLSEKQPDIEKMIKGPVVNIGLDENKRYTNAAVGFAKKNNVDVSDLSVKDNYIWANVKLKGESTARILQTNIPSLILGLQGQHFMRWAALEVKFQRPIRWIVSLADDAELQIAVAGVESSRYSKGHRFACNEVEIKNAGTYIQNLYDAKVIVDARKRKELIVSCAKETAKTIEAEVILEDDLLDEVTYLTEWPVAILCGFDKKYLDIPEKVVVTVMASHQRYFPIYKDGRLLNNFITMANYVGNEFDNIRAGNERVIKARLDDAIFFFNEDTKKPLSAYLEDLKGITFQKGMGSVYDKTQRLIELSRYLCSKLNVQPDSVIRTAQLCKADLAASLVFEFTELQGFIGSDYALLSKENSEVAVGIKEHYFPLSANSKIAGAVEGQVVGIADKIDTTAAVFAAGKKPSGSQDPLGIRRGVLGILKTIISCDLNIDLVDLIKTAIDLLPAAIEDKESLKDSIVEFFEQRLIIYYGEKYRHDVLAACVSGKNVLSDLKDFGTRAQILSDMIKQADYQGFHDAANRILRILKPLENQFQNLIFDESLLVNEYEKTLWHKIKALKGKKCDYAGLRDELMSLVPDITGFFDNVLVMDEDEKIKKNRLALLFEAKTRFLKLADFSKVVF